MVLASTPTPLPFGSFSQHTSLGFPGNVDLPQGQNMRAQRVKFGEEKEEKEEMKKNKNETEKNKKEKEEEKEKKEEEEEE